MTPEGTPRRFVDGISIGVLTRIFHRGLIDDVLRSTGRTGQRTRLLPGRVVVYFVLALCLFFEDPYEEVMRKLVNGLTFLRTWTDRWKVPTSAAMTQARKRVGDLPFQMLFAQVAAPLARPGTIGAWFAGWRVMAVDGVVLDAAATPENLAAFGLSGSGASQSPFPQIRLVGLGECGTHAITAAAFDSHTVDERTLLRRLFPTFEPGMLVLADRGYFGYELWRDAAATGAAQLWRIKRDLVVPVLQELPDGSYRSELLPRTLKSAYRQGNIKTIPDEVRLPVRVLEYTVTNRAGNEETIRLLTSILDHEIAPAGELAMLYQQRWEFELTLDEVETHQMPANRKLRSKLPSLVRQEIWALLLVHYAVRSFMREAADDIGVDPDRLSFTRSINVLRRQVHNQAGFSPSETSTGDPRDCLRNPGTT
jgi:Insertion element 4 transposase N-terminal/Transposase DDE domain